MPKLKHRDTGPLLEEDPQPTAHSTDGSTVSCCDAKAQSEDLSTRSLLVSVTKILPTIMEGADLRKRSVKQIVESLLFTFIARRKGVRFESKAYGRFIESFKRTRDVISDHVSEASREQDFVKYHLAVLLCRVAKDKVLPPRPDWNKVPLFSGYLKRIVDRAVIKRDLSFINSLYQSKRIWPKLGKIKQREALEEHKRNLCTPRCGEIPYDFEMMIEKTAEEIYRQQSLPSKFMPSSSACFEASREEGGAASLFDPFHSYLDLAKSWAKEQGSLRSLNLSVNNWRDNQYRLALSAVEEDQASDSLSDAEVVCIPEPAKFRIITKGNGYLYTALQPTQGQLLSGWKRCRHSTMTIDLDRAVDGMQQSLAHYGDDWVWCSVDYKSATDLLFRKASLFALRSVPNLFQAELAMRSLRKSRLHYPDGSVALQEEGQLMGHPLSFPLLCLLNLSAYRTALRRYRSFLLTHFLGGEGRKRALKLIYDMWQHVLVNGDDMLFKAPREFMPFFYQAIKEIGFQTSVGKNYVSQDCALINSRWYRLVGGHMRRQGYLNLKLLTGISLKNGLSSASPDQIGKDVSEMVDFCSWTRSSIPMAFSRWSSEWKGWFQPNWYLPVHLGGYGVSLRHAPDSWMVTKSQRLMATRMASPELAQFRLYKSQKIMDRDLSRFMGATANWTLVPSSEQTEETEAQRDITDDWLVRIAYCSEALLVGQARFGSDAKLRSDLNRKELRSLRLKTFSQSDLANYWYAYPITNHLPVCPPMNTFTGDPMRYHWYWSLSASQVAHYSDPLIGSKVMWLPSGRVGIENVPRVPRWVSHGMETVD